MARLLILALALFAAETTAFQAPVSAISTSRVSAVSPVMFSGKSSSAPKKAAKKVARKAAPKKVAKKVVKKVAKKAVAKKAPVKAGSRGIQVIKGKTSSVSTGLNGKSTTFNILSGFGEAISLLANLPGANAK